MDINELEAHVKILYELVERNSGFIKSIQTILQNKASISEFNKISKRQDDIEEQLHLLNKEVEDIDRRLSIYNKINSLLDVNITKPQINQKLVFDGDRWTNTN